MTPFATECSAVTYDCSRPVKVEPQRRRSFVARGVPCREVQVERPLDIAQVGVAHGDGHLLRPAGQGQRRGLSIAGGVGILSHYTENNCKKDSGVRVHLGGLAYEARSI